MDGFSKIMISDIPIFFLLPLGMLVAPLKL